MRHDELLNRVNRRVDDCVQSHRPDAALDEAALAEEAELWQAAQPQDRGQPTAEEAQRLAVTRQALGWLRFLRYTGRPDGADLPELAMAVAYLEPLSHQPDAIPKQLRVVLGPTANPEAQGSFATRLLKHAQTTPAPFLLDAAINLHTAEIAAAPDDYPHRAGSLSNLSTGYLQRYERTGVLADLDQAIKAGEQATATSPPDDPDLAMFRTSLGNCYRARYRRMGAPVDLERSIELCDQAVAATPPNDRHRASRLNSLGVGYLVRFEHTGVLADIDEAIKAGEQAIAITPPDHPDLATWLTNLATSYRRRHESGGAPADLARAIDVAEQAVAITPADRPGQAALRHAAFTADPPTVHDQALGLFESYQRTGDVAALVSAIERFREAVEAPIDYPDRAGRLSNLGVALRNLFERTGQTAALEEAVAVGREAVAATPTNNPDRATYLSSLGNALAHFGRGGRMEVLEEAVAVGRQAVAATPTDHPNRVATLNNLALALRSLLESSGRIEVLEEAVAVGRQAAAGTPTDDPRRVAVLNNLGLALHDLFERTGQTAALEEAVAVGREAVAATPTNNPDRTMYLNSLGIALYHSGRSGRIEVLDEAVAVFRQAAAATPTDHPRRVATLNNLGDALQVQFGRSGRIVVLEEAVAVGRQAVALTSTDDPDHAGRLNTLAGGLRTLSERTGQIALLDEAVGFFRKAVAATPTDHPDRGMHLNNLGIALQTQFERTGHVAALEEALACSRSAGDTEAASVPTRVRAWRNAAEYAGLLGQDTAALAAAEEAVALLPLVLPQSLVRADRERRLGDLGPLAGTIAAAATGAGDPQRAVTLLEQTRGLLVADTLAARSGEMQRLANIAPALADDLIRVRASLDALDQPRSHTPAGLSQHQPIEDAGAARQAPDDLAVARARAAADWNALVIRVRALDGFQGFLTPPSIDKLAVQARPGPVVFITTSPTRCDALILTPDPDHPVRLVPLTALSETIAYEQADRLLAARRTATDPTATRNARLAAQSEILDVLGWLWDTVTSPVLTALTYTTTPTPETAWPRVWWCPVRVMAYLPLHAAGHHADLTSDDPARQASPRTVLDRVVSSYATTVRGLAYARTHHADITRAAPLIIAAPIVPGAAPLPGVAAEAAALATWIPNTTLLSDPTRDTVLTALPQHPIVHFSCHGLADWNDPSSSRLILPDHLTNPLTVADVSALQLTGGLAYLSACDTMSTGPRFADEAVHITGAFHLAGYEHVVGTLWPINDSAARQIADDFYRHLTNSGATLPDPARSAEALHHAIRSLRAHYPGTPTLWAAHTHTGT